MRCCSQGRSLYIEGATTAGIKHHMGRNALQEPATGDGGRRDGGVRGVRFAVHDAVLLPCTTVNHHLVTACLLAALLAASGVSQTRLCLQTTRPGGPLAWQFNPSPMTLTRPRCSSPSPQLHRTAQADVAMPTALLRVEERLQRPSGVWERDALAQRRRASWVLPPAREALGSFREGATLPSRAPSDPRPSTTTDGSSQVPPSTL